VTGSAADSFFRVENDRFVANDAARGPWVADACHAGPVTGLIARALEHAVPDKQLTRITVNFQRPVPMSEIHIEASIERDGRSTARGTAIVTAAGKICAITSSLHIAANSFATIPSASVDRPKFAAAVRGEFPLQHAPHGLPFFGNSIEVAHPPGDVADFGPATLWMRTPPILAGELRSPVQSLCPLADCGNGISRNGHVTDFNFVNPDLTVAVFRLPQSEWLASRAVSFWEPTGVGLSQAQLFDTEGAVGFALQSLLVRPI